MTESGKFVPMDEIARQSAFADKVREITEGKGLCAYIITSARRKIKLGYCTK